MKKFLFEYRYSFILFKNNTYWTPNFPKFNIIPNFFLLGKYLQKIFYYFSVYSLYHIKFTAILFHDIEYDILIFLTKSSKSTLKTRWKSLLGFSFGCLFQKIKILGMSTRAVAFRLFLKQKKNWKLHYKRTDYLNLISIRYYLSAYKNDSNSVFVRL